MELTMSISELRALLVDAGELAAKKALADAGLLKPYLSRSQAEKKYGRPNIARWTEEGLLNPSRGNEKNDHWKYDRHELEAVYKASLRHSFIKTG
ncbi:MAG: hypothetical protein JWQ28_2960 [Pedobacter sp.]|jgi:hypothetical protein|nr:hypothetical protein [Pedobacter sp.]